ncbi:hypothetical protein [Bacteroides hominis]|uniref:hypothetical protein n=1 Tax=Bacteroides hominis TaxID=2763023 RepID=UPI002106060A|nr:hypothetical protein [Bacteroides hominis (ex Liu et al. 2022)]
MGKSKHLSEDEIKYIVSAETSKAQKEIHELTKKTASLKKEERERRKAMIELEAQGKKNSEEYDRLAKECKEYTRQISVNNKKIDESRKKLDVNAMSMVQLKKQAKDLRAQMDNMSKALNPSEYADLEQQLRKVSDRMGDLKNGAKSIAEIAKSENAISTMFGIAFTKGAEWVGNMLAKMKDFVLEGIEMAASADGVTRAFKKIDDGTMLDNLRQATKGTVTDLELMKATVKAKDFRIPLEDLGKYLQFAQLKAQQTGQSVEYMTESIVTGLGRKSLLILDNLGLSAAEINEQVSKTGDFMSGVAAIVDKQLAEAGGNYVSAADRAIQKTVMLQNAQRELGEVLLPIKEEWDDVYNGFQVSTMRLIGWIVKHRAAIMTLGTVFTTYIATQKIATLWNQKYTSSTLLSVASEKLQAIQLGLSRKAFLAKLIVMDLYRGRCNLATASTEIFNLVLKASPLGVITSLLAGAAAAFILFRGKTSESDKAVLDFNKRLESERVNLNNVFKELKKTNPGTSERSRLVKELNDKYPGLISNYNLEKAKLQEITRAQNEANTALTNRIATEMKARTVADFVEKNVSTQMEKIDYLMMEAYSQMGEGVYSKFQPALRAFLSESSKSLTDFWNTFGEYFHSTLSNDDMTAFRDAFISLRSDQKSLEVGIDDINKKYEPYIKSIKTVTKLSDEELKQEMEATSKIKQLEKERQHVQDTWKEDTQENIILKNQELEKIDNEIKKYRELGTAKAKADADNKAKSAADKAKAAAEKEKRVVLDTEKDTIKSLEQLREEDLQEQQKWYNTTTFAFNTDLTEKLISQEQHDMLMIELEKTNAENRLKIEQSYYQDAQSLEMTNGELKEDQVRKAGQRVLDAEKSANAARAVEQQKLNDLIKDFKSQFKVTTVDEDYDAQKAVLEASYQARKEMAEKNHLDTTELDKSYYRASEQLEMDHQARIQAIRDQYGISNQQERFNAELAQLKSAHEQGYLEEEEYQKAVQNLKRDSFKKQFDYYSNLFSGAVQALQQAEMDNVDALYDTEIEAAQGNSEEVERLEKEKAQKKLDIQKKYADVNFAIKVSQIIADTSVSIMRAFADLGPIAGAIAAALMGVTGAAQIVSANAERQKVKNMTLSGSSSSSKGGTRIATGRQEGGKIDVRRAQDGKLFPNADYDPDARGFIDHPTVIVGEGPVGQSREWVASNATVENPTVAPILNLLDQAQQAGTIRTLDLNQVIRARMAGFSSGGAVSKPLPAQPDITSSDTGAALPPELMLRLARAIISIDENGVPASVVLSEIDRKQKLLDRSRSFGSKY